MEVLYIYHEIPGICFTKIITKMLFLTMKVLEFLQGMEDVDLVLKIPANLPISIVEFFVVVIAMVLMLEVDIGLNSPDNLPLAVLDQ